MRHTPIKQQKLEVFYDDMKLLELGFTTKTIKEELELLKTCPNEIDYITAIRVGKTVRLNRKNRKEIYALYELWFG